ncbi:GyrI-like domain-containing protein [Thalassovita taeanensis]|uniref:GyrI-like small molecule binding domain-containing protein n=1 Tax=Thalassovita taeanensis TaxID=657014 RepID=A0A1H9CQH7_9RHOB|nr:GyrI-like domain-containing protein [Thalassovita taeanensis]SEQ03472.1 hypothetical protein SAMN04488092_103351 [Thalassovita taeanensis]
MDKLDFRKRDRALYAAKAGQWSRLNVPPILTLRIEGQGDPNGPTYARALAALYPLAYGIKFAAKARGADFAVPPLEALWWADDPAAFTTGDRAVWRWAACLRVPDDTAQTALDQARTATLSKRRTTADPEALAEVHLAPLDEGDCLQTLHIGPYTAEAPVLVDLHCVVMPGLGLTFNGPHHEIYLSDPRRVAPGRLKTLLRQPVRPL